MSNFPVIQEFNKLAIKLIKSVPSGSSDPDAIRGDTGDIARTMALLNIAMYDAVANISGNNDPKFEPVMVKEEPPEESDEYFAAASAGKTILKGLFGDSDRRKEIKACYEHVTSSITPSDGKNNGTVFGNSVAGQILSERLFDVPANGTNGAQRDGGFNASWRSQYAQMKPFVMPSPGHISAPPPPPSGSQRYSDAVNEVLKIGERASATRNGTSTAIAQAWNGGPNTSRPSGAWFEIALAVSKDLPLKRTARLFSLLGMAICDAMITSWHLKSIYDYWRPASAIRNAHLDGNDKTCRDLSWVQLSRSIGGSPEYTSGTATFAGAASTILTEFFEGDQKDFTINLQESIEGMEDKFMTYNSFKAVAEEASMSRLYNGIHFRFSTDVGMSTGIQVGKLVLSNHYA